MSEPWAELHCHSSYSFLDGASSPADLVAEATELGVAALAITDHDGMYGAAQFAQAAARRGLPRTVFGAELSIGLAKGQGGVPDPAGSHLLVLARDRHGYGRLCSAISTAQLRGKEKGRPVYDMRELAQAHDGHWAVLTGCRKGHVPAALAGGGPDAARAELDRLTGMFGPENVFVELICRNAPDDDERNDALFALAAQAGVSVLGSGNVHYATPRQARLADTLAAIRARRSLAEMDGWLAAGGTAYLRSGAEMKRLLRRYPGVFERTVEFGLECAFDFRVLAPDLPPSVVPEGHTEASYLRKLAVDGAAVRYGSAEVAPAAYAQIAHELDVIEQLNFPGYFLIVHDIVQFCRDCDILCQGRGSAANSAVCYAIGITSVDPVRHGLLFERFLSEGRDGPPDIDLDIEHRRREEVIQYVYGKYGRERAAQVANVISYQPRMAARDVERALGGASPELANALVGELQRLPRHLGIHSGGMVLADRPVGEVCPVEWARMPGRTVLQWDKDDCAYAGLVKFDLLGLGMLAALHDCFDLVRSGYGHDWSLATLPPEDPAVYDMLCAADTVGVFQVESRAQMSTLPRLRPRCFYDLVIEVALIRPGPIQGGSVHPYLRRRAGLEPADLPHPSMERALSKTLGVPLFQEQMMQIAIDCAGFTPPEADQLRLALSAKRAPERVVELRWRLVEGMTARGIPGNVAEDIYDKILSFSSYGFPESHAISFAYLVYASAYLKRYYPAAFTCALLRNQPMGFYAPHSLVNDARRHGVRVLGVDVNASEDLATLEPTTSKPAVRLGLSLVRNLGADAAKRVAAGRPYADLSDFALRTGLSAAAMESLATGGAFGCFGLSRREALWAAGAAARLRPDQLPGSGTGMEAPALPSMTPEQETLASIWATSTYDVHPVAHVRPALASRGVLTTVGVRRVRSGSPIMVAGLVTHRQKPPTAGGVVFISLEDETGMANIIVPPWVWDACDPDTAEAPALVVQGRIERSQGAVNVVATALRPMRLAATLPSRDFR